MKKWMSLTALALSMSLLSFAGGPQKLTDNELNAVEGGQLAICCAECHGHPDGSIHCTGCRFCEIIIVVVNAE